MKAPLLKSLLFCSSLCLFVSFTKDEAVQIKIASPTEKSVYKFRDTVWVKADISSSDALHDVMVKVVNLKDSTIIFSKSIHSHSNTLSVKEFYINPVFEKSDVKLSISTTGHGGIETARKEVVFKCLEKKKK